MLQPPLVELLTSEVGSAPKQHDQLGQARDVFWAFENDVLFGFELDPSTAGVVGVMNRTASIVGLEAAAERVLVRKPELGRAVVGGLWRRDSKGTHFAYEVDSVSRKPGDVARYLDVLQPPGAERIDIEVISALQENR
jgi:hypothetical protein